MVHLASDEIKPSLNRSCLRAHDRNWTPADEPDATLALDQIRLLMFLLTLYYSSSRNDLSLSADASLS